MERWGRNIFLCGSLMALALLFITADNAGAQVPSIGPQVRIDTGGGTAAANETTIASINANPDEIVAGWNDWRSSGGSEVINVGVAVSNDGGQTWTDFHVRPPLGYQSGVEGDPMTCYDNRTGTLWVGGMSWGSPGGVYVARKNPGANTFQPSVMTYINSSIDKGWMAAGVDPFDSDATRVHVSFNFGNQYSTDMGSTWSSPVSLGSGIGFLPRVGPNGELYVCYWDYSDGVMLKRSFDGGATFGAAIRIATRMDVWSTQDGSRFPGDFRVPSMNYLAVDPNDGTLYCVFFDTTDTIGGNSNVDLYFTKSTDQGSNWTTPVVINSDSSPAGDQFWPWLEVDTMGRIHMVYYNTRHTVQNDNVTHGMFDAYYAMSADGGTSWDEYRLTPASFDSYDDGLNRSNQFLGDYLGLGVGDDRVYPCYLSTQNGDTDIYSHVITFPVSDTVSTTLDCVPGSGVVPFNTAMWVSLTNEYDGFRRVAARINVTLASGSSVSNWRSGWTNLDPDETYSTNWTQNIPAVASVIGDNVFSIVAEDVTPAPYNQPPYAPAGATDTGGCTVTGVAP